MRILGLEIHRPVPSTATLRWLLELANPDTVIDVGANEGQFYADVRSAGFRGKVIMVEPIPSLAERLAGLEGDVHAVAAGDGDEWAELTITRDSKLSSLHALNRSAAEVWRDDPGQPTIVEDRIRVPVRRLDGLLGEERGRMLVKLDTQGHDLAALTGMSGILDQVFAIQTELAFQNVYEGAPTASEHLDALRSAGFGLAALVPIVRTREGALVEADGFFVRLAA